MSQSAYESLMRARDELLAKQRKCAWCDQVMETACGLVRHILENHPEGELDQDEKDLLIELQRLDAK